MTKQPIAFTGGHHNSALVIAKLLSKENYPIIWLGHKFASYKDKNLSAEYQEVLKEGFTFLELKTGKYYQTNNPLKFIKIGFGFLQAFIYLLNHRPQLIFSSGGYLSVPVVIVGWLLGIPSITHEQTVVAGWANKAISPFVKKILLTYESSKRNFPSKKTIIVGLPLREEILNVNLKQKYSPPLLYISCGKQGSHLVNQALFPLIPELVNKYTIYHQTGANTQVKDQDKARRVKESLGKNHNRYQHAPYFFAKEAATCLQSASIVISRAGAHAVYELSHLKKRTIFIPISWASHNEQQLNAQLAKRYIPAVIIPESQLSSDAILKALVKVKKLQFPTHPPKVTTNATTKILAVIHQYLPS